MHGVRTVHGLIYPPDVDSLRDIGFAQAIRDGNGFGDPVYGGEVRWYPPLIPALLAGVSWMFGVSDIPAFWIQAAPWVNLLVPATLFLAARRILGSSAAGAMAMAVFVCFDGSAHAPWVSGGYSPWPLTPVVSEAMFFATLWLIAARGGSHRRIDAAMIGAAIGVTFLAHPVPAIILTVAVTVLAFVERGIRSRTVAWLAVTAIVQLALMSVFLVPILLHYPGGEVNHIPSSWLDEMLMPTGPAMLEAALFNAPGVLALVVAVWLHRRGIRMARGSAALLGSWIAGCAGFLMVDARRNLAAAAAGEVTADTAAHPLLSAPMHHFHLYLELAWPLLIGFVGWQGLRLALLHARPIGAVAAMMLVTMLVAVGTVFLFDRTFDRDLRAATRAAPGGGGSIDLAAYRWILANTRPGDLFVTPLAETWGDPAAFAVYAAARKLLAAPLMHSNPYVAWPPRDARRRAAIAAATNPAEPVDALCRPEPVTYLLLPFAARTDPARLDPVTATVRYAIYRVRPGVC